MIADQVARGQLRPGDGPPFGRRRPSGRPLWQTALVPHEAGSASGALGAVQQLAAAIGSAVVTSLYFSPRASHCAAHATTVSVAAVGVIALVCLGLVWLLPKEAPASDH